MSLQRFMGTTDGLAFHEPVVIVYARELNALEAKLSKMEEALKDFWADSDNWDFDGRGPPDSWYPVGELAEEALEESLQ